MDWTGIFFAQHAFYLLAIAVLVWFLIMKNVEGKWNYEMLVAAAIAALISRGILTEIIRAIYFIPRPFVNYPVYQLLLEDANRASFPSGHMAFWWAVALVVYKHDKKFGVFIMLVSLVMGVARVFVGVHWPSDILGGIIIGSLVGWLCSKLEIKNWIRL